MTVTIYHNPACGTSRNVLAMIRERGVEPKIVEYLKTPPTAAKLQALLSQMGISARELLRKRGTPYDELGLDNAKWSEADLIGFMTKHPILIERPIVETPKGTRLCRPKEKALEVL
jgi:arsenate reductase